MDNWTMKQFGNGQFHNGHYINPYNCASDSLKEIGFDDFNITLIDEEEDRNIYTFETAHIFLQGSCDIFSRKLHELFGYEVYEIRDTIKRTLIHCYARSTYNGKTIYIDVRGATTDFNEFYKEFSLSCNDFFITLQNLGSSPDFTNFFDTGSKFACAIIEKYSEYYDFRT